jgi:hypothetical protein
MDFVEELLYNLNTFMPKGGNRSVYCWNKLLKLTDMWIKDVKRAM